MNGKQINGLCKVINAVTTTVRLNQTVFVNDAHVMMVKVEQKNIFGVEDSNLCIDVSKVLKMKIEETDFDASLDEWKYILKDDKSTYTFKLTPDYVRDPTMPSLGYLTEEIETDVKTLKYVVEKCEIVSNFCTIKDGCMSATGDADVILKVGEWIGEGKASMFPLEYLKKLCKVMTGKVKIEYDMDFPCRIAWTDGSYDYTAMIAPKIKSD